MNVSFILKEHDEVQTPSCFENRFAELESIVALAMFVSRYKIEIKEEPQFAGETFEQRKERILATVPRLTLTWVPSYHSCYEC